MSQFLGVMLRKLAADSARLAGGAVVYLRTPTARVIDATHSSPPVPLDLLLVPSPEMVTLDERIVHDNQGVYKTGDRVFHIAGSAATKTQLEAAREIVRGTEVLTIVSKTPVEHSGLVVEWRVVAGIRK